MTDRAPRQLEDLSRAELARLGREFMLYGHIYDRALMPQVGMHLGGGKEIVAMPVMIRKYLRGKAHDGTPN